MNGDLDLFYSRVNFGPLGFGMENAKMTFSVTIVLFNMKMHSNSNLKNTNGQGYLVTMAEGHLSVVHLHFKGLILRNYQGNFI